MVMCLYRKFGGVFLPTDRLVAVSGLAKEFPAPASTCLLGAGLMGMTGKLAKVVG